MTIREAMIINAASRSGAYSNDVSNVINYIDTLIKHSGLDPDKEIYHYTNTEVRIHGN